MTYRTVDKSWGSLNIGWADDDHRPSPSSTMKVLDNAARFLRVGESTATTVNTMRVWMNLNFLWVQSALFYTTGRRNREQTFPCCSYWSCSHKITNHVLAIFSTHTAAEVGKSRSSSEQRLSVAINRELSQTNTYWDSVGHQLFTAEKCGTGELLSQPGSRVTSKPIHSYWVGKPFTRLSRAAKWSNTKDSRLYSFEVKPSSLRWVTELCVWTVVNFLWAAMWLWLISAVEGY